MDNLVFLLISGAIYKYTSPIEQYLSLVCFLGSFILYPGFNRLRSKQYNVFIDEKMKEIHFLKEA